MKMPRSRRDSATLVAVLSTALGTCSCAGGAWAQTGGMPVPEPVAPSVGESGYGAPGTRAIVVARTALLGDTVYVRGTMPGAARRRVILQRRDSTRRWRNERRGRVRSTQRFLIRWPADRSGRLRLRVVIAPRRHSARRVAAAVRAPIARVNVYRPARATFFGPGLYGKKTACGQTLTPLLLGVAHTVLECGTRVSILYQRREIVVPVVDRGPYHEGYSWDLTQASADALGFTGAGAIGYIRVGPAS